jgi:hypothetical protein
MAGVPLPVPDGLDSGGGVYPQPSAMLGVGPEWVHSNAYGIKQNSVAAEVAPDFMFWPFMKHRLGWYFEPSYEYKFGPGHEHSLGITGGLLIGIP